MFTITILNEHFLGQATDPRVKSWKFMDSPMPTLTIIAMYLLAVLVILPAYMRNRKPYNLTTIIRYYNVLQIVSCIAVIYMVATSGWVQGELTLGCQPVDYSESPSAMKMVASFYWVYFLKMVELIETVFFVLRKKFNQVTGLHVYHHSSTLLLAYIGCKFIGGGMASVPIMVNSFIHVLMYTYYYFSSFPEWQKALAPWKPKLTMLQMIQFTFLIAHALQALQPNCGAPKKFLLIYVPNVAVIFKMFYDFYKKAYHKKADQDKVEATKRTTKKSH